jgi:hypothetical protein
MAYRILVITIFSVAQYIKPRPTPVHSQPWFNNWSRMLMALTALTKG